MMDETAPEMLNRLGTDAAKWAAEFRQTAIRLGYSDMDEGWLIGWFANAIEHTRAVDRWAREAAEAAAWEPIETASRDGTPILATGGGLDDEIAVVRYLPATCAWETPLHTLDDMDNELNGYSRPTHWRPLPAPPKESPDAT